jgi:hypothetical protein
MRSAYIARAHAAQLLLQEDGVVAQLIVEPFPRLGAPPGELRVVLGVEAHPAADGAAQLLHHAAGAATQRGSQLRLLLFQGGALVAQRLAHGLEGDRRLLAVGELAIGVTVQPIQQRREVGHVGQHFGFSRGVEFQPAQVVADAVMEQVPIDALGATQLVVIHAVQLGQPLLVQPAEGAGASLREREGIETAQRAVVGLVLRDQLAHRRVARGFCLRRRRRREEEEAAEQGAP